MAMAITMSIRQLLQQISNNVLERVPPRGGTEVRLKLADGKSVMLLHSKSEVTEYGKY